jgi:hypothetical protein
MENCGVCYTCESGIVKTVTVQEFRAVKDAGKEIPKEWYAPVPECERCYTCQRCYSAQQGQSNDQAKT